LKYLALLLFIPALAFADAATDRDSGLFLGGGFGMGQDIFNLGNGATASKFLKQGWALEGGMTANWGNRFGGQLSGEYGANSGNNTYASQSNMETGTLGFYSFKAGIFYGPVTLGAGYRHNDVNVKSLSLSPGTYLETNYSGFTPLAYASYSLEIKKRFRTAIEAQYVSGTLSGSGATSGTVKFSEAAISLRFFFVFD
jgi:hypothetical protein